jgi:hypothetical protein
MYRRCLIFSLVEVFSCANSGCEKAICWVLLNNGCGSFVGHLISSLQLLST